LTGRDLVALDGVLLGLKGAHTDDKAARDLATPIVVTLLSR
jgi:hypothetical protein